MDRDIDKELALAKEQTAELTKKVSDAQAKLNWQKENARLQKIYFPEAQPKPKSKTNPAIHQIGLSINLWLVFAIILQHYLN